MTSVTFEKLIKQENRSVRIHYNNVLTIYIQTKIGIRLIQGFSNNNDGGCFEISFRHHPAPIIVSNETWSKAHPNISFDSTVKYQTNVARLVTLS